jgi:hypothetical protein
MPVPDESAPRIGQHKNVLLVGSSHAEALTRSHTSLGRRSPFRLKTILLHEPRYEPWGIWQDGEYTVNSLLLKDIAKAIRTKKFSHVTMMIGGSTHFELSAVNSPRKFDFTIPGREDLPFVPGAESVPFDLVKQLFLREEKNILKPLFRARELTQAISCLCAPPPVANAAKVFEHMPDDLRDSARSLGVPEPVFRYKVWLVYTSAVREICLAAQIELIEPPAESIDENGFLKDEYSYDTLHGNTRYGVAVLAQIDARIAAGKASAA